MPIAAHDMILDQNAHPNPLPPGKGWGERSPEKTQFNLYFWANGEMDIVMPGRKQPFPVLPCQGETS